MKIEAPNFPRMIIGGKTDAYTKEQADAKFQEKLSDEQLKNISDVTKKADADDSANALKGTANDCRSTVTITDISPVEHSVKVKIRSKNLIKQPYYDSDKTQDGITWTVLSSGGVMASGTATANTRFSLINSKAPFKLEAGKTYTTSAQPTEIDPEKRARVVVQSTDYKQNIENAVPTVATRTDYYAFINIEKGTELSEVVFFPQLEEGTVATEYEPYKESEDFKDILLEVHILNDKGDEEIISEIYFDENGEADVRSEYPWLRFQAMDYGVVVSAEYNRDINKAYSELINAIISLGGNV